MWQYQKTDELYHYGVLGMKWGIRRNARVVANHRRNTRVKKIKDQYELGNISKSQRNDRIKQENINKRKYISDVKNKMNSIKDKKELNSLKISTAKQAISEVPHNRLKKGLTTVNKILTGVGVGHIAINGIAGAAATAAISPALGGVAIGAAATTAAYYAGYRALIQMGLDKLS